MKVVVFCHSEENTDCENLKDHYYIAFVANKIKVNTKINLIKFIIMN